MMFTSKRNPTGVRWMQWVLSSTILVLLSVLASDIQAQVRGLARAIQAQQQHNPVLFRAQGVVATGIGSDDQGQAVIKVFTTQAGLRGIPGNLNGVSVVTEVSGAIRAFPNGSKGKPGGNSGVDPTSRFPRPVPIGVSIGTYPATYCFAGTLGCRIRITNSLGNAAYYLLSNNHVLAEENLAILYPSVSILQPGTLDAGCVVNLEDEIGVLADFVPLKFDGTVNYVDAAIGSTTPLDTGVGTPTNGYGIPLAEPLQAFVGLNVQKYGRTTGLTHGFVDAINVAVNVTYDTGTAYYEDQIIFKGNLVAKGRRLFNSKFSDAGDSGSLIVSDPNRDPVGLLFAGSSTITVANDIGRVLDNFSDADNIATIDDGSP